MGLNGSCSTKTLRGITGKNCNPTRRKMSAAKFIGGILGLERGFFVWIYSPLLVEPECQILNGLNDFGASYVKPYGVTFHNVTCCKCTIEPPNVRGKCGKILRPTKNHPQLRNGTHPYISDGCPPHSESRALSRDTNFILIRQCFIFNQTDQTLIKFDQKLGDTRFAVVDAFTCV